MKSDELQRHMLTTYTNLRIGMAVIAFLFPIFLYGIGKLYGISLPNSISAYYHETVNDRSMRDVFIGVLCAMGAFLYLYKGYTEIENIALNLAGIFVIGVAFFPMAWGCEPNCPIITLHYICAFSFFLCIAYVCIWRAKDTLQLIEKEQIRERYKCTYWWIGVGMILSPMIALLLSLVFQRMKSYTFFVEATGVWIFAIYWLIKSWELSTTKADSLVFNKQLETNRANNKKSPASPWGIFD